MTVLTPSHFAGSAAAQDLDERVPVVGFERPEEEAFCRQDLAHRRRIVAAVPDADTKRRS